MANTPRQNEAELRKAVSVWKGLRPTKKFLGLTVEEFEAGLKDSFDARDAVTEAEARLTAAINARNAADEENLALVARLVAAVKADVDEGENSEVLDALGFVIPSKRKSGLHRKGSTTELPKAA